MTYERKIEFAIDLLRSIPQDGGPIEVSYSGGKDSDVILELAKMAGIPFEAIYKQTTIDPPGTTSHAKAMGATIIRPKHTFLELVARKGLPSRERRFCCEVLKEYRVYDRAIQGIRRSESTKLAKLYKEPEMCRTYSNGDKVRVYYPILDWTDEDVERFIRERGIKCAPVYYNADGSFHVERRLGCLGCPLKSNKGLFDFKKYPKLLKAEISAYQKWLDNHPGSDRNGVLRGKAYNAFFLVLFCKSKDDYIAKTTGGLFPETAVDTKQFLEDYFQIEL